MPNSLSKGFGHDLKTGSTRLFQQYPYDYEFSSQFLFPEDQDKFELHSLKSTVKES